MKISSSLTVSSLLPEHIVESYPTFVEFVKEYYKSQEVPLGNLDLMNNILYYYHIQNYKLQELSDKQTLILDEFCYKYLGNLPQKLNPKINYSTLIPHIREFNVSKGTEKSVKTLFKLLFDDTTTKIKVLPRGSGAVVRVDVLNGAVVTAKIISGGSGYNSTFPPNIEVVGVGSGAILQVSNIVNGVITAVSVINGGILYTKTGNNVIILERDFDINSAVTGSVSGATGKITYWSPDTNELYLKETDKNFRIAEVLTSSNCIATIKNIDVVTEEPSVILPYDYTIKTNSDNSVYSEILLELNDIITNFEKIRTDKNIVLTQNKLSIYISDLNVVYRDNERVIVKIITDKTNSLYVPPTTKLVSIVGTDVVVDSTVGFPNAGTISLNGEYINYTSKTVNKLKGIIRNLVIPNVKNYSIFGENVVKLYRIYKDNQYQVVTVELSSGVDKCQFSVVSSGSDAIVLNGASGYQNGSIFNTISPITKSEAQYDVWNNVLGVYDTDNYVYVAAAGTPTINTNPRSFSEQTILKRFAKNNLVEPSPTSKGIGLTTNGVEICSYKGITIDYGRLTSINIVGNGDNYFLPNKTNETIPSLYINDLNYNNLIKIYASLKNITLDNINKDLLSGFNKKPEILITRNNNDTTGIDMEIEVDYDVSGVVNGLIIKNPGRWYTEIPEVKLVNGGKYLTPLTIPKANIFLSGFVGKYSFLPTELLDDNFEPINYNSLDIPNVDVYTSTPVVYIKSGSGAVFGIVIELGVVVSVSVENSGNNYYTSPQLKLINTSGVGAIFLVNVQSGRVISAEVISGGSGYFNNPSLIVDYFPNSAVFVATIDKWTYNIVNNNTLDNTGGYVYNDGDIGDSKDVLPDTNFLQQYLQLTNKELLPTAPSPIIGWAYDGVPIYGGYVNKRRGTLAKLSSGWSLKSIVPSNRPNFLLGTFVEDYEYTGGDLDEYNGMFAYTKEFPDGKYCYFATDKFPYYIGNQYKYKFDPYNHLKLQNNCNIPSDAIRIYNNESKFPTPNNKIYPYLAKIDTISYGSIDNYLIEIPGFNYKNGDIIKFEDNNIKIIVSSVSNLGEITELNIIDSGNNLNDIPPHKILTEQGIGAVITFGSTNIGTIKNITNISNGDGYGGDPTINYSIDADVILDIKFNNTIVDFDIITNGIDYTDNSVVLNNEFSAKLVISNTGISDITIIDSEDYYETIPTVSISNGIGAIIIPILAKSDIDVGTNIYYGFTKSNYVVKAKINNYNKQASTLQVKELFGRVVVNNEYFIWNESGQKIGKIYNIHSAKLVCTPTSNKTIHGNQNNDSIIKFDNVIADNMKHQQYSYSIKSPHSINEWKQFVVDNVHMLGNKISSIYSIDNIIKLYLHRETQIRNIIDYKINIENVVSILTKQNKNDFIIKIDSSPEDLYKNTKLKKQYFDYIWYNDNYVYSNYSSFTNYIPGDTVWLTENHNRLILKNINPNKVLTTDYTIIKFNNLVNSTPNNSILNVNGVVQHPLYDYSVANNNVTIHETINDLSNRISLINLPNSSLTYTDKSIVVNTNTITLTTNTNTFVPTDISKLIMFVNNVPNNDYNIVAGNVAFTQNITGTVYGIYSDQFTGLNLSQLTNKIYTITNNPTNNTNILLFVNGVLQPSSNYIISGNTLNINTTDNVNHLSAHAVDDIIGLDDKYSIFYNSNNDHPIVPAKFNFVITGGRLRSIDIVFAGLNYPRYMMLALEGVANPAKILLECLNGSVVRTNIIDSGVGLTMSNYTKKLYYYGAIESQKYPIIDSSVELKTTTIVNYLPIIPNIFITPNIFEVGNSTNSIAISYTLNRYPNTSVSITDVANITPFILADTININYNSPILSTKTYTIATVDFGNIVTASTQVKFLFKTYWGNSGNTNLTNSEILAQSQSKLTSTKNDTYFWNNLNNQYIYLAYPASYGTPTFTFYDFVVTFEQQYISNFVNTSGGVTDYYVYRSENRLNGSVTITVS